LGTNILDASGFGDTRHHETAQLQSLSKKQTVSLKYFPNTSSTLWMSYSNTVTLSA